MNGIRSLPSLITILAMVLIHPSCAVDSSSTGGSNDEEGGGPLLHPAIDLHPIDKWLVGLTVGYSTIELIDPGTGTTTPIRFGNGDCPSFPIAVATANLRGTRHPDLLVMDPGCGNWIAVADDEGTFLPTSWSPLLPEVPPSQKLVVEDWSGDGVAEIMTGDSTRMVQLVSKGHGKWEKTILDLPHPWLGGLLTTNLWLRQDRMGPLIQLYTMFGRLDPSPDGTFAVSTELFEQVRPEEWQIPFAGFDHLVATRSDETCEGFLLGVGVHGEFSQASQSRTLQVLRFGPNAFYPTGLHAAGGGVQSFAIVQRGEAMLVGLLKTDGSTISFVTLSISDCGSDVQEIARFDLPRDTFPVRNLPSGRLDTLRMAVIDDPAIGATFYMYDGFNLLAFHLDEAGGQISFTQTSLHRTRNDHAQ